MSVDLSLSPSPPPTPVVQEEEPEAVPYEREMQQLPGSLLV